MSIYTYVVDHGKETPVVGVNTVINGGKLQGVMFDDAFARIEAMDALLTRVAAMSSDNDIVAMIHDFYKPL